MTAQMQLLYCNTSDEVRWQLLLDWPESDMGFLGTTETRWCGDDDEDDEKVTKYNQFCTRTLVGRQRFARRGRWRPCDGNELARVYLLFIVQYIFTTNSFISIYWGSRREQSRAEQSRAPHPPALVVRVSVASVDNVLTPWRLLFTSSYVYILYILFYFFIFFQRKRFIFTIDQFLNFYWILILIVQFCKKFWRTRRLRTCLLGLAHLFSVCAQMFNIWTILDYAKFLQFTKSGRFRMFNFAFVISAPLIHIFLPNTSYVTTVKGNTTVLHGHLIIITKSKGVSLSLMWIVCDH